MSDAPIHEEVVNSVIAQAKGELVEKVNSCHSNCQKLTRKLAEITIDSINEARRAGIYLTDLMEQTPDGHWTKLFSGDKGMADAPIHFSYDTARLYIKLAHATPEPIKTLPEGVRHLKDMLIAVHALPASQGHGEQTRHEEKSPFQSLVKFAGEMQGCLSQWRKQKPVTDWEPQLKDQVKSQLKPLVDFYQSL